MNVCEKLIFNALVSGQPVRLTGRCVLIVELVSAREESGRLYPPRKLIKVVEEELMPDAPALTDHAVGYGASPEAAEKIYTDWIRDCLVDRDLNITGCGKIEGNRFITDSDLEKILNPSTGPLKIKKRNTGGIKIAIAVISILAMAGAAVAFYHFRDKAKIATGQSDDSVHEPAKISVIESGSIDETPPETATADHLSQAGDVITDLAFPVFHIVGGVFSTSENAERFIDSYSLKYPDAVLTKVPYAGSKFLVSIYSTDNE